ncbi:MAG: hypothetical protein OEU91_11905, partial [Gammaproteobacteria bacterium]|nr:hypothetical protein [Gammaproteobacteria bacterium]
MSKKATAGNILIVAVSLLVAALLAEVVLRQIRPVDFGRSSFFRIPHPVYGWVLEPGVSYINYMREAPVPVSYNSNGWRDIEHAVDKPDGVTRILVLGDSFMEAYSVPFEDSLPARLQQLAGRGGQQIEVINLGVAGYGTLQEYLVYRDHGKQYQPDIVLLGFYVANDVRNNSNALESLVTPGTMRTGSPPFLDPGGEEDWKLTMPLYEATMERYLESKKEREAIRKASGGSALLMGLLRLPGKLEKAIWEMSSSGDAHQEKLRHLIYQGINYCKEPPEWTEAWDITRRVLARLDREITEAGSKLMIFSVPAMHDVDIDRMNKVEEDAPESGLLCLEEAPGYARL